MEFRSQKSYVHLSFNLITGYVERSNANIYGVMVDKIRLYFSVDPSNNHIDLSLRGKDVGEPDLMPAPKRKTDRDGDEVESPAKKRKISEDAGNYECKEEGEINNC